MTHEVELPVGLADASGALHRRAEIRKMRGHEEALLYDRDLGPAELMTQLIAGTLVRLGTIDDPGPDVVRRLYSADRNLLLLRIRRLTLGDGMAASYACPSANQSRRCCALSTLSIISTYPKCVRRWIWCLAKYPTSGSRRRGPEPSRSCAPNSVASGTPRCGERWSCRSRATTRPGCRISRPLRSLPPCEREGGLSKPASSKRPALSTTS